MTPLKDNMKEVKEKGKKVLKTLSNKGSKDKNSPPIQPGREFLNKAMGVLFIFLALMTLYSFIAENRAPVSDVPISEVAFDVARGDVTEIKVSGESVTVLYGKGNIEKQSRKEPGVGLSQTFVNYGVPIERLQNVKISVEKEGGFGYWFLNLAPFIIPILFIAVFIWFLTRQVKGAGMQAFTFGQSKPRIIFPHDKKQKVTFKDVAGVKEAKQELAEIVDFLKNPKKFLDIGAEIPKGVLLMGASGTGKTLLARAVAGEAGVPFFSISGSEFVELFVGVGASRVRDLFKLAKQAAPAIVFIDEIDAVGRVRGTGVGGGNDEREQTLNQILVEMDGFEQHDKVIVMAATNRSDVLDSALVRPGRFDRRVVVDLPDRNDREAILKVHALKKQLAEDVNLRVVAERTPGFSGADLHSIVNEAAILAAREERVKVAQFDLIRSIEKVMLGPERKSHLLSEKEKEITAYHEAGHALVSSVLPYADPVHKVSIIARGRAGGYTLKLPLEDRKLQSRREFLDDIAVTLGGFITEEMLFGDITTGPSNDLQVASALARDMVTKYGMSEKLGPIAFETLLGRLGGQRIHEEKEYGEKVSDAIDAEVAKIIAEAYKKAETILVKHRVALDAIATKLIEVETLEQEEYEKIIIAHGIMPKKKKDIEHQK
ncbi:MAG: Lysyl-tRNA synthetase [Parcubacteria group bacterium GW2011_GWA2_47_64]|nr:MAG: Lysyl-tRNA synthetase [Parcubacteria group bacterium GW2011_GWA2_47_64]KKU96914.1 MAG: Lysyl-tRNA synthetase [Parcubacteria group bacterium GW2011_GWC2_48_17]